MEITVHLINKVMTIETTFQRLEISLSPIDFKSYELDNLTYVFPIEIREKGDQLVSDSRQRLGTLEKLTNFFLANNVTVFLENEYQQDLIIRSLYDFCSSILIGRIVYIVDATNPTKDLLKAKHIMSVKDLEKRYRQTKEEDYLLKEK